MSGGGCGHGWENGSERNDHEGHGYHTDRGGHGYHTDRGGHGSHTDPGDHGNHTDPGGHGCRSDHGCGTEGGMSAHQRGENESHKDEDRDCWIDAGACHAMGKECAGDVRKT